MGQADRVDWESRSHFVAIAARQMRQILVDHARRHRAGKRGAGATMISLDDAPASIPPPSTDLLALDEALEKLAEVDPRKARAMELKFFGGLEMAEIAAVLNLSIKTVEKDVRLAGVWLRARLSSQSQ
jgi:RNA polymerase sigma factor (TIGR02999 family)